MDSIYPPRYLALAFLLAGHLQRKCVAVSISPHLSLLDMPMVHGVEVFIKGTVPS